VTMLRACIWLGPESLIPAAPGSPPGHTKNAWARSLQGLLFDILPTLEPNTVLGELTSEATSLCRGFQTIGGQSSRNLNFCTSLLEPMLERLARCSAAGREDTLRLLQPLNRLLFNFGWDPRNPNPLVDMRRLNNRLQECILSWAEGPEPYLTPLSPDPSEWKTDADKLRPEPPRYHMAQSLGNPYCVYYGHVVAEIRNGPDTRVEGIGYNDDPRRDLLIARCAVMEWKTRFKHERTSSNTNLKSFLTVKKYRHTTEDAMTAIQSIARSGNTHYLDEFGWDLVYAVELLATIDPVTDREDLYRTRRDDVLTDSAPEEMRAALLANRGENSDNICFGAFLASVVVVNNLGSGKGFHGFLSSDPTKARERFRIRILGRPQSRAEFNKLSPEQIAHRLDRVPFLLHLRAQAALKSQKSTDYSPQKSSTIFELPSGLRNAVAGSLQATPEYLDTFKRLFARIGIDSLPGWPID